MKTKINNYWDSKFLEPFWVFLSQKNKYRPTDIKNNNSFSSHGFITLKYLTNLLFLKPAQARPQFCVISPRCSKAPLWRAQRVRVAREQRARYCMFLSNLWITTNPFWTATIALFWYFYNYFFVPFCNTEIDREI